MTSIRPCGPKRDAVRGATFDLLDGRPHAAFSSLPDVSYAFLNDEDRGKLQVRLCLYRDCCQRDASVWLTLLGLRSVVNMSWQRCSTVLAHAACKTDSQRDWCCSVGGRHT